MSKKEMIKVKSVYCEMLESPIVRKILERSLPVKMGYWIVRAIEKIRQEAKAYMDQRNKLTETHEDTKKRDEEKKKGDCLACGRKGELPPGQIFVKDAKDFQGEMITLQETELNLGIEKIDVDLDELDAWLEKRNEKGLSGVEFEFLLPFFKVYGESFEKT